MMHKFMCLELFCIGVGVNDSNKANVIDAVKRGNWGKIFISLVS